MQGPQPVQKTPTGVTVAAVIAFVYGLLALICSGWGAFSAASQADQLRAQKEAMSHLPNAPFTNTDFYDKMIENAEAYTVPTIIFELFAILISVAVVVVGARLIGRKPDAPRWLKPVFITAAVYTLIHMAFSLYVVQAQQSVMEEMMSSMQGPAGAMGGAVAGASMGFAMCLMVVWGLLKLSYFVWGLIYFRKPHVQGWFDGQGGQGGPGGYGGQGGYQAPVGQGGYQAPGGQGGYQGPVGQGGQPPQGFGGPT